MVGTHPDWGGTDDLALRQWEIPGSSCCGARKGSKPPAESSSEGPRSRNGAGWRDLGAASGSALFACANWLSSRGHIPQDACARPDNWAAEFKADWKKLTGRDLDAETEGPRFSTEEAGRLLNALSEERIDPRLRLNIYVGGDSLRAGQVRRAMRSRLNLGPVGEFGLGRLQITGSGRKKGSTVDLDSVVREQPARRSRVILESCGW